mgnify:CR=1 FL=1
MPHDVKGQVLRVGDTVTLRAKITSIQIGEEYCNAYCNAVIESLADRKPDGRKEMCCLNTAVLEKLDLKGQLMPNPDGSIPAVSITRGKEITDEEWFASFPPEEVSNGIFRSGCRFYFVDETGNFQGPFFSQPSADEARVAYGQYHNLGQE